jgi:hypothetical protein
MNSGCELPIMEVTPRSFMEIPLPGAPELEEMLAPVNFPYNALSSVAWVVVPTKSLAEIDDTAFARFDLFTDVAKPVTTTSSRLLASCTNAILRSLVVGSTENDWDLYPTKETSIIPFLPGSKIENLPEAAVVTPTSVLFLSFTEAPGRGSPLIPVTVPVTVNCAQTANGVVRIRRNNMMCFGKFLIKKILRMKLSKRRTN